MARSFLEQPNGNFSIYSSYIDDFVLEDATWEEVVEEQIRYQTQQVIEDMKLEKEKMERKLYPHKDTFTYEKACQRIKEIHGDRNE